MYVDEGLYDSEPRFCHRFTAVYIETKSILNYLDEGPYNNEPGVNARNFVLN